MNYRFCPLCATPLEWLSALEDSGLKERLRCAAACGWTHWNNPTPVLAAIIECTDRAGACCWPQRSLVGATCSR
jgi:NAD+ diphosphatase